MCISFSFINQSILSFKTNFPPQKRKIYPTFAISPPKRIYSSKLTRTEGKILFTGIQSRSTLSKHSRTLNFPSVSWKISPSLSLSLNLLPREWHAGKQKDNFKRGKERRIRKSVLSFPSSGALIRRTGFTLILCHPFPPTRSPHSSILVATEFAVL